MFDVQIETVMDLFNGSRYLIIAGIFSNLSGVDIAFSQSL